jgi:hypothetical protein
MQNHNEIETGNYEPGEEDIQEVLPTSPTLWRPDVTQNGRSQDIKGWTFITPEFEEQARAALTFDMYQRKTHDFQLVSLKPYSRCQYRLQPSTPFSDYEGMCKDFPLVQALLTEFGDCLCAAGGAVANELLMGSTGKTTTTSRSDVDLFFYGLNPEEATTKLEEAIAFLVSSETYRGYEENPGPASSFCRQVRIEKSLKYVNVKFCYGTTAPDGNTCNVYRTYQFVLRIYPTKASVIAGFDIPLSCFLYDGQGFYCTPLAEFCWQHRVVIANLSRESPSFQYRLVKYANRFNYAVYYPGLSKEFYNQAQKFDLEAIKADFVASLKKHNGRIYAWHDYDMSPQDWIDHLDEVIWRDNMPTLHRIIFYPNGRVQLSRSKHLEQHNMTKEAMAQVSDYGASYAGNHHVRTINSVACIVDNPEATILCKVYSKGKVQTTQVLSDFKDMCTKPRLSVLTVAALKARFLEAQNFGPHRTYAAKMIKYTGKPHGPYTDQDFQNLLQKHATNAKRAVNSHKGVQWMTKNPGSQWTSSFQPMFTCPKDYYGQWYQPFWVGIPWEVLRLLYLGFRDKASQLSTLSNDTFRLVLTALLCAYGHP